MKQNSDLKFIKFVLNCIFSKKKNTLYLSYLFNLEDLWFFADILSSWCSSSNPFQIFLKSPKNTENPENH